MTPFDDFVYLINHVLLGEEPTIEDFILLVGTLVAFIAFILWCCFPIQPKEPGQHRQFTCKIIQNHIKAFDAASRMENNGTATASAAAAASSNGNNGSNGTAGGLTNGASAHYNGGGSGSYSKNGTVSMHNYYVKNGHHCCT
ncbi:PREDICTED: uncharacterized protein LOC108620077 isoform X1 [Drosophila arizonae]|uniref:Uncharacterized protein LOC108620077 isoform X1 n=1 Tax=Drosophila arizonae TaxID=7263 RepID=A0ABM1PYZ8_DROAR|nr:PREDICTED: uncharacterized protein LOC108620077 isoform X1 [Drosophila arizonae]